MRNINEIDTLSITGGGVKDIALIGSLKVIESKGILKNIKKYAGSSAGGIICVLLNLGLSPDEILNTIFAQKTNVICGDIFLMVPLNMIFKYGFFSGKKMVDYIENLFNKYNYDKDITFKELYKLTGKVLVLTGTSLNVMDTYYFNYQTTPNMRIIDALRITISIPIYFSSVKYEIEDKIHTWVDGGVLQNFPIYYYELVDECGKYILNSSDLKKKKDENINVLSCSNTIGLVFLDKDETNDVNTFYKGFNIINNIKDYFMALVNTLLNKIREDNFTNPITGLKNNFFENVICVKMPLDVSAIDFNLSDEIKDKLMEAGEIAANDYFNGIIIKDKEKI